MRESKKKFCVVLLIISVISNVELTVENEGHGAVLVSFSQNVPSEDGLTLAINMMENLEDASKVLHNATGLRFSKVIFKIPTSWDTTYWEGISIEETSSFSKSKADFLIDNATDVVFGRRPLAQQYGGCGVPGHQIIIPKDFFDGNENEFPRGKILAREWLKYRYGVFDENGFFKDPMYPQYYTIPGSDPQDVQVTDCTNTPVTYNCFDQNSNSSLPLDEELLDSGKCDITPEKQSLENVVSSIMYHHKDILDLEHVCGKNLEHKHNSRSPNKHNALCFGQSIWDVMKNSSDFVEHTSNDKYSESNDIEYAFVRETPLKIVVAWEDTKQLKNIPLKEKSVHECIIKAVKKLMIDLPVGSQFNGFPFESNLEPRNYTIHVLNGLEDKKRIESEITSDFVKQSGNTSLAISKALEILSSPATDSKPKGTIIILTTSGEVEQSILDKLKDSDVCVTFILFSASGTSPNVDVSGLSCATVERMTLDGGNENTFEKLFDVMEAILPTISNDKEIKTVATQYLTEKDSISVEVDDTIENVTFWVFDTKSSSSFELTFHDENKINEIHTEVIGVIRAMTFTPTKAGEISFKYPHETEPFLIQVRTTSKAGHYFSGDVVIHETLKEDPNQMPLIIYVFLRYGAYPVQNAIVSATIQRIDGAETKLQLNEDGGGDGEKTLQLVDDGRGDPDITQNDGVYSRYFTKFEGQGEYTVTIKVSNNGDDTTYGADQNAGNKTCCGSYVTPGPKVPKFNKEFKTSFTSEKDPPEDGYKPSRIVDLKIDSIAEGKIVMKWTAPGGEADDGKANSYEIKYFSPEEDIRENFDSSSNTLDYGDKEPEERGKSDTFEIDASALPENSLSYIAMKAKNANKTSDLSNVVGIFIPEHTTTTPKPDDPKDPKKASTDKKTIGIVVGVIVGLIILIIIVYIVIYATVLKPKRKKEIEEREREERERKRVTAARDNNAMNPISYVPASTIMEHHNEKTRAKLENKEPPVFKEEDFEDRKSPPENETGESSSKNDQPLTSRDSQNTALKNNGALPPKSPKRTTPV